MRVGAQHDAHAPDLAFSGSGNQTPWLVWSEVDDAGDSQVYAARGVEDAQAAGGLRWQLVGQQSNCLDSPNAANCQLNFVPSVNATAIRIASGQLLGETIATPWVVFTEEDAGRRAVLRVLRLDLAGTPDDPSDNRFISAGDTVNEQCLGRGDRIAQAASDPDLVFVGSVPHVAWIDDSRALFVCHLADVRPGQERWDLDTLYPLNYNQLAAAAAPNLSTDGHTPFIAWQEQSQNSNVYVAHRYPSGPAWGSNRPPYIRTISWSRDYVGRSVEAALAGAIDEMITRDFTLTTSCDHVNGWEEIREIQFQIANDEMTAFAGRYVQAEDRFYVLDGTGEWQGPYQAGVDDVLATPFVLLNLPQMRMRTHGPASPVVDIDWVMSFRSATMLQDFKQALNSVYENGEQTGFFATGEVSMDYRVYATWVQQ